MSDVLTTPGKPVKLQANVFEKGLLGRKIGLGGESLEFLVQGKVVGTTMTGGDGRAYLEYTPRMRGNLAIYGSFIGKSSSNEGGGNGALGLLGTEEAYFTRRSHGNCERKRTRLHRRCPPFRST